VIGERALRRAPLTGDRWTPQRSRLSRARVRSSSVEVTDRTGTVELMVGS
jgi:hypothetical protein